jgi:hypothetical protein
VPSDDRAGTSTLFLVADADNEVAEARDPLTADAVDGERHAILRERLDLLLQRAIALRLKSNFS